MSDGEKEAARLLFECADELRRLDDGSLEGIKAQLRAYFEHRGLDDPYRAADVLVAAKGIVDLDEVT